MAELEVLLDKRPNDVEAMLLKGVILTRMSNTNAAINSFTNLTVLYPELPEPHNNLAVLYAAQHRYEDARKSLLQALELQPHYDTAYENLGDVYAKLAAIAYDRAYQLNRTNQRAKAKSSQLADTLGLDATSTLTRESDAQSVAAVEPTPYPTLAVEASRPDTNDEQELSDARSCYRAGPLDNETNAASVASWAVNQGANASEQAEVESVRLGFRVFLGPLESKVAAEVQIGRMRTEGINDIFRTDDNAIALGVYGTRGAAENRANGIEAMGYRPEIMERFKEKPVWFVQIGGNAPVADSDFRQAFPEVTLHATACAARPD